MTREKAELIIEAMNGITYSDWKKLRHCIDARFNADTSAAARQVPLADAKKIIEDYQHEFL